MLAARWCGMPYFAPIYGNPGPLCPGRKRAKTKGRTKQNKNVPVDDVHRRKTDGFKFRNTGLFFLIVFRILTMLEYRKKGTVAAQRAVSNRIYAKWYLLLSFYSITSYLLLCFFIRVQNAPYMDEVFHVFQLRSYCKGAFNEWDSKITTPPGLYLITLIFTWPLSYLLNKPDLCWDVGVLRGTVLVSSLLIPIFVAAILRQLHGVKDEKDASVQMLQAFASGIFPVLYFFNFLYYTDVVSTVLVLFTFWLYLGERYCVSACVGLLSVSIRQTNILWVALCAVLTGFRTLKQNAAQDFSPDIVGSMKYFTLLWTHSVKHSLRSTSSFLILIVALLRNLWAYALVGMTFIAFVIVNGSIVLGDKAAHEATLHFPQVPYFCAFTLFFTSPLMISKSFNFLSSLKQRYCAILLCSSLAYIMIHYYTMAHPYLLADNRHYTFYLWKWIIDRAWWTRYALIPVYVVGSLWIKDLLVDTDITFRITWAVCTAVCLVPQRLLEFRYYIIPFTLLRLHYRRTAKWELLLEIVLYVTVNAATIYLFVTKKIRWHDMKDYQRIMW